MEVEGYSLNKDEVRSRAFLFPCFCVLHRSFF